MTTLLERKVQTIWLITFGDLLTLLLCFFIAVISLSGAGYRSFQEVQQSQVSDSGGLRGQKATVPNETSVGTGGTIVATLKSETGATLDEVEADGATLLELGFSEVRNPEGTVEASRKILSPYLERRYLKGVSGDIETCTVQMGSSEDPARFRTDAVALNMRRQLIDFGFPEGSLRIRSLGTECGHMGPGLRGKAPEAGTTLRMVLRFTGR